MHRLLIFLLFLSGFASAQPKVEISTSAKKAYQLVLSLRFEEANLMIDQGKKNDPNNLFYPYLENYRDFLSIIISEDENLFEKLGENKKYRIQQLESLPDDNPYKKYLLGNVNLQWAVARVKFGEYFTTALEFNRAYRLINENTESFPDFFPNQVSLGVIHAMVGVVPDSYQWILNIINMSGTVKQGRNELIEALNQCNSSPDFSILQDEIRFYLGFMDLNLNPNETQNEHWINTFENADPNNLLLKYLMTNIFMKTGQNDQALNTLFSINANIQYYPFYYLDYLKAECQLRKLDYREARQSYQGFISRFMGKNYIKDAYRNQAWCALLQGDTTGYRRLLSEVKTNGYSDVGIDKEAQKEAESDIIPNLNLLRSRLLFDGGYYDLAYAQLEDLDDNKLSTEDILEKKYRQARIGQQTGRREQAKKDFLITIQLGRNSEDYFAANSALMLGRMYEEDGDFESAKSMYRLCLDLDFTTYRNSIRGKAKQRLSQLE